VTSDLSDEGFPEQTRNNVTLRLLQPREYRENPCSPPTHPSPCQRVEAAAYLRNCLTPPPCVCVRVFLDFHVSDCGATHELCRAHRDKPFRSPGATARLNRLYFLRSPSCDAVDRIVLYRHCPGFRVRRVDECRPFNGAPTPGVSLPLVC
jgi:hypothetical protein